MKVYVTILTILFLTICTSGFSQKIQKKHFLRYEIVTMVNGEVYEISHMGRNCDMTINYKERAYYFSCISIATGNTLLKRFKVVETMNGRYYARNLFHRLDENARYMVADSTNERGKIEFIEYVIFEDGTPASLSFRFLNRL